MSVPRFRYYFNAFLKRKPSRHAINLRVDLLERWLDDINRFYPFPALAESVRHDINRLLALAQTLSTEDCPTTRATMTAIPITAGMRSGAKPINVKMDDC